MKLMKKRVGKFGGKNNRRGPETGSTVFFFLEPIHYELWTGFFVLTSWLLWRGFGPRAVGQNDGLIQIHFPYPVFN